MQGMTHDILSPLVGRRSDPRFQCRNGAAVHPGVPGA